MDLFPSNRTTLESEDAARIHPLLGELGEQAHKRRFEVAPNPCVGAAVLSDGVEIGRGFHGVWGGPHAEIQALEAAAKSGIARERWDTLVVTLEPCSSTGKTPPCTEAIVASGVRRVVVGELDPDPRHRGRGLELLRESGLDVVHLVGASPLALVAPHFLRWTRPERLRRPRPWTLAKWAQTRTGQLLPPEDVGEGRWISGPTSRAEVQVLRSRVDAVLIGLGTLRADDPRLTVRPPGDASRAPLRIVLDTELFTPPDARLFASAADENEGVGTLMIVCRVGADPARHRALIAAGAEVVPVSLGDDGRLSLRGVASWLWDRGVRRLLLEAGPTLLDAWFRADLVDQLRVYTGNVNGGCGADLAEWLSSRRLEGVNRRELGDDDVLEAFTR